ncbi:sialate O-acetylesterase [Winogradskyella sp. SYSU M77433]|uniref:sialate O-acetylesterase n=1 Tax=Winogradskyella sp. SYSU M77433 TaxID=3042722 RepID=UPI0024815603|nr:sialate O-acetylesterase [Winogradskyella sp. SYSU M77433]MDH7911701.1 sialate O-acetylesterase [Winogradskyella sp. SYSU M77433]
MKKIVFTLSLLLTCYGLSAEVILPSFISDGMVLQRNAEVKVWGWASPNERVTVDFNDINLETKTNSDGEWMVVLKDLQEGGPYQMVISGTNTITINNIFVGDVWLCSGQSNMELPMRRVKPLYKEEIATAQNSRIHYIEIPQRYNFKQPQQNIEKVKWQEVSPETISDFSAVAYFFAKELYDTYQVPIGLINASLGGSPAESWLSEDELKKFPHYFNELQQFKNDELIDSIQNHDNNHWQDWHYTLHKKDIGNKDTPWHSKNLDISNWDEMEVPGYWIDEELGDKHGVVWFRKDIDVPKSMLNQSLSLELGRVVDSDSVYVNGTFVGTTGYKYPPRWYTIPKDLLVEGENNITVRVINESGNGGFYEDKPYRITSEKDTIDLKGTWNYKLGADMPAKASQTFIRWKPTGLYNAMIAPLLNYELKGVIWYQGESNVKNPKEYETLFPCLIENWRAKFNQDNLPFLFVQLANYLKANDTPTESSWAELRNAQLKTLSLPNTAMAVTIDIGEWNDIHPLNKKDVGKRLALAAKKIAYKDSEVVYSGPILKSYEVQENEIILEFENTGSGLMAKGGELKEFAIAGADKKFVWAKAEIKGDKVIVTNPSITNPVAVRYAWADNPDEANLYNKEELPASPFKTDKW